MAEKDLGARAFLILLDTDVLIEVRRQDPKARSWFDSLSDPPIISGIVAIEFIIGSRDRAELDRSKRFLRTIPILWPSPEDGALAYDLVSRYKLSTGLGLADYHIAAQALNSNATLYTFNLRHFGAIPGLDVRAPYDR